MKRALPIFVLLLCFGLVFGQSGKKLPERQESGFMGWVHDAWKTVQEEGRPAAERIVKEWPKRFQDIKATVGELNKKAHDKVDAMNLEQKKQMLLELWRVRKSLDLLTLLKPDVLHSVTGLDTSGLKALEDQAASLTSVVSAKIHNRS